MEHDQNSIRLGESSMSWPTKFEPNLISSLSANVWKLLDHSEARKMAEIQWSMTKSLSRLGKCLFFMMPTLISDNGYMCALSDLTHWGRVTHICVSKLTIIGSDNSLSPGRRQAIIWTNVGILSIGPLLTNSNETSIEIHTFSFKKIYLKLSFAKWRPFCPSLNVLR